jgi:hypothetical protein
MGFGCVTAFFEVEWSETQIATPLNQLGSRAKEVKIRAD